MAEAHPTTTWEAMPDGLTFYSKHQVYMMQWNNIFDLTDFIICGARYGGPLAMMRDTSKLAVLRPSSNALSRAQVQIWSSAGEGLLLFTWDQGKVVKMGWTGDERLVLLNEEGIYRLYDLQGNYEQFTLGGEASEVGIMDARIYEEGLVALTNQMSLLEIKGWRGGRPTKMAETGLTEPPQSWCIIPPEASVSGTVQVLLSSSQTLLLVDTLESVDQRIARGPFTHVSPSPNGKYLALLTFNGILWVVSTDFQNSLAEYDTTKSGVLQAGARQVEWCGNDAILVSGADGTSVLVGPMGDTLIFTSTSPVYLAPEPDGIRIISSSACSFLRKVSPSSLAVFKPGSIHPSAILFDAWDLFSQKKSPTKIEESIRNIRVDMASAVDGCIDAAGREWEPYWQRKLLEAAKFGRAYLDLFNPTDFVNMGQALRVLNAVRFYEVGIPLSYAQYLYSTPERLIQRLTHRHFHLLAFRASNFLRLKPDSVLKHWACAKLSKSTVGGVEKDPEVLDDQVCREIVKKFEEFGGKRISYADVAKKAWEVGRRGLATKLLDHESQAADQVPLLLQMKEDKIALLKAVDSGDTDLVYHVLLNLYGRLSLGSFFKLLEEGGDRLVPASKLLQVYAREQNRDMLRDFYYSDDRRLESAVLALEEASKMTDVTARVTSVKAAQKFFNEDKDKSFEAKMTGDHVRLLALQQQFEKEDSSVPLVGLSVNDTITACLANGMAARADKVRSEFKISEKRFWYLKLHAFTKSRDFIGLETFARSKKSPIGYEPFVHHLVEKGHLKEAISYVARCEAKKRVDLYVACGEWRMAGKECKERGDRAKMEELRKTCPNTLIQRELDQLASSM